MAATKVLVVGAAGETGRSIINGLFESPTFFEITALVRPSSIDKRQNVSLKDRGVKLVAADLNGPQDELVKILTGIDVVISAIGAPNQIDQIPLATAAKAAGVKRFIPCGFITIAPLGGVLDARDIKEEVYNHIRRLYLPYTIIDVGWWYQLAVPKLPSGKTDYTILNPDTLSIFGKGNVPSALTDLRDVGRYVARVMVDPRTLNKMVFTYGEVWKQNQIFDLMETVSGEKIERNYVSASEIYAKIAEAKKAIGEGSTDMGTTMKLMGNQYIASWGLRGENTPDYAEYLGYITSKELYPDFEPARLEDYFKAAVEGKADKLYADGYPDFSKKQ